jgi:proton-translocating NADH-quinone oxidoreductase chain N
MNFLIIWYNIFFMYGIVLYMISFFIERYFKFIFFLLVQTCFILICGLLFIMPLYSFENIFYMQDRFVWFIELFVLCVYLIFLFYSYYWFESGIKFKELFSLEQYSSIFEFLLLSIIFVYSGFLFISSQDLLYSYIFLEIQSICLYILAAFGFGTTNRSSEAALKYFIFGALFSGLFLLGWILIYFATGLTNFFELNIFLNFLVENSFNYSFYKGFSVYILGPASLGFLFLILAIIAKLGLFPFHFWMIDVYDSVSNLSLLFFSLFPKIFLLYFLLRLFIFFFPLCVIDEVFQNLILFIGTSGLLFGSLINLSQWKIKRFLAFSSLVNLSYILLFFTGLEMNLHCIMGIFLNLMIYIILLLSFFVNFLFLRKIREVNELNEINDLFLVKQSHPLIAFSFFINTLSFAGVPPLIGFYGKFYLLSFLWGNGLIFPIIIVLITSLISCFYYIRIARSLFNFNSSKYLFQEGFFSLYLFNFFLIFLQFFFLFIVNFYFLDFYDFFSSII